MSPGKKTLFADADLWKQQTTPYLHAVRRSLRLQRAAAREREDLASVRTLSARLKPISAELKRRGEPHEPTC